MSFFKNIFRTIKTGNNNVSSVAEKIAGEAESVLIVRIVKQAAGA